MDYQKKLHNKKKNHKKIHRVKKRLNKAENLLTKLGCIKCENCQDWCKPNIPACDRCSCYLCEKCLLKNISKCNRCRLDYCSKCSIWPEFNKGNYLCSNCFDEPRINIFIPDYYLKLPNYHKEQIFTSLLVMNRFTHKPPKYIRFLILNFLFEKAKVKSHIAFCKCCYKINGKKCGYPVFTLNDKYCVGCKKRSFYDYYQDKNDLSCLPETDIDTLENNIDHEKKIIRCCMYEFDISIVRELQKGYLLRCINMDYVVIGVDEFNDGNIRALTISEKNEVMFYGLSVQE